MKAYQTRQRELAKARRVKWIKGGVRFGVAAALGLALGTEIGAQWHY
ncbi:MAG: hypothetical protein HY390_06950 [Deltaproteobacteria bacterium]|nr:hypothetical protein [Deltaproteobacteria bacterium]